MLRIPFPDSEDTVKMAYLGHNMCRWKQVAKVDETTGETIYEPQHASAPFGLAFFELKLAAVMNFDGSDLETRTAIHEFGHFYGARDHYGGIYPSTEEMNAENNSTAFDSNCTYGENDNSADFRICAGCQDIIKSNIGS